MDCQKVISSKNWLESTEFGLKLCIWMGKLFPRFEATMSSTIKLLYLLMQTSGWISYTIDWEISLDLKVRRKCWKIYKDLTRNWERRSHDTFIILLFSKVDVIELFVYQSYFTFITIIWGLPTSLLSNFLFSVCWFHARCHLHPFFINFFSFRLSNPSNNWFLFATSTTQIFLFYHPSHQVAFWANSFIYSNRRFVYNCQPPFFWERSFITLLFPNLIVIISVTCSFSSIARSHRLIAPCHLTLNAKVPPSTRLPIALLAPPWFNFLLLLRVALWWCRLETFNLSEKQVVHSRKSKCSKSSLMAR